MHINQTREQLLEKKRIYAKGYRIKNREKMLALDRKRHIENRVKRIAISRRRYHENPERAYFKWIKVYGLSGEEYKILLNKQNGVCAICKTACSSGRRLAVDHCHVTGRVRGLLCANCNTALGKFKDSPSLMVDAIRYIEKGVS